MYLMKEIKILQNKRFSDVSVGNIVKVFRVIRKSLYLGAEFFSKHTKNTIVRENRNKINKERVEGSGSAVNHLQEILKTHNFFITDVSSLILLFRNSSLKASD